MSGHKTTAFDDAGRRTRPLVWVGIVLACLVLFTAGSVIGTSTNWFCTRPCHIVHDDNTKTYMAGSHSLISCVACHEPVNGDPVTFVIKKLEVAPDLVPTVFGTFTLPMNEGSYVAVEMADDQCTQCHSMPTRVVNPSAGIIIDHDAHAAAGVTCPTCHNRVAHPEESIAYTLPGDEKHENWMTMQACFRCHQLVETTRGQGKAPGDCAACHPADFDLTPPDHDAVGWYTSYGDSAGHASAARAETSRVAQARIAAERLPRPAHPAGPVLPPASTENACEMCLLRAFCDECHGLEMPLPAEFATTHGEEGL
ncbi:MAG: NapC/NirT family cytochrome c, partial [Coriobacteriales bacterium]